MKQILFKYFMLITCVFVLSSCGYLLSFGQLMFDGSCADWNCSKLNPRWEKAVDTCTTENRTFVLHELGNQLGYKSITEVSFSEIGQHISSQCIYHSGKYDIHKDKQYGHLFAK